MNLEQTTEFMEKKAAETTAKYDENKRLEREMYVRGHAIDASAALYAASAAQTSFTTAEVIAVADAFAQYVLTGKGVPS